MHSKFNFEITKTHNTSLEGGKEICTASYMDRRKTKREEREAAMSYLLNFIVQTKKVNNDVKTNKCVVLM